MTRSSTNPQIEHVHNTPPPGGGAMMVFTLLVLMGVATLTPCILLPEWHKYEALNIAVQREAHELAMIREEIDEQMRLRDAIRNDPGVVERLAQRELNYRRPDMESVLIGHLPVEPADKNVFIPKPVDPPPAVRRLCQYLPDYDFDAIFCEDQSRSTLMTLSIALLAAAFVLFRPRPPLDDPGRIS